MFQKNSLNVYLCFNSQNHVKHTKSKHVSESLTTLFLILTFLTDFLYPIISFMYLWDSTLYFTAMRPIIANPLLEFPSK